MFQNTTCLRKADIKREQHHIDATNQILGRLATRAATLLRGTTKPGFTPHIDNGDFVAITNASKVRITGNKASQKFHFRHSGYPGGVTLINYGTYLKANPDKAITEAIKGMLPKTKTRKKMLSRLAVYRDAGPSAHRTKEKPKQ
ncbi:MAG: 50S ribosomal protein L13 [Elusimicrobia bacterium]|nr:50S ribosomal protein L13 [Elusimicrobiota bacterium]MBD3411708.1 50S ribosomal protein L13 [Elusimicrobiota bacterium]